MIAVFEGRPFGNLACSLHQEYHAKLCYSLQTDYFMAALAVIYRNIFRSPKQISAKTDVESLRAGLFHLERQVHPSGLSSMTKGLFRAMVVSAENLVSGTY